MRNVKTKDESLVIFISFYVDAFKIKLCVSDYVDFDKKNVIKSQ